MHPLRPILVLLPLFLAGCFHDHQQLARIGLASSPNDWQSLSSRRLKNLTDDDLRAALPHLQRVAARELHLSGEPLITDAAIPLIAQLPSLRVVALSGTQVTADGLAQLRTLPRLDTLIVPHSLTPDERNRLASLLPRTRINTDWRFRDDH